MAVCGASEVSEAAFVAVCYAAFGYLGWWILLSSGRASHGLSALSAPGSEMDTLISVVGMYREKTLRCQTGIYTSAGTFIGVFLVVGLFFVVCWFGGAAAVLASWRPADFV